MQQLQAKRKILLVSSKYHPEYSGSGYRAHNTYKRLAKYGIDCDVICNSINFSGNSLYEFDGKQIYRIASPFAVPAKRNLTRYGAIAFSALWEAFYCWRFLLKNADRYALLHTFGNSWTVGFMTLYFASRNKPIIRELCNEMTNPYYPIQLQHFIAPVFKKDNTVIIAISNRLQSLALKFGAKNIWTRVNPVDTERFCCDYEHKQVHRAKLCKFSATDIVISLVANYCDRKNQRFALEVLKRLDERYKLVLAGPLKEEGQAYFETLQVAIRESNLQDRVDLQHGFVNNFDEYIKMSDVFLFPSKSEGLGTPLLEAQACGVPVVSNAIPGITDMVLENSVGGYALDLDAQLFATHVGLATQIPHSVLEANAAKISAAASCQAIDAQYLHILENLMDSKAPLTVS